MDPVKNFLTRIGLGNFFAAWVGSGDFCQKSQFFNLVTFVFKKNLSEVGQKIPGSKLGQTLTCCWSEACSGRVRAHLLSLGYQKSMRSVWFHPFIWTVHSSHFIKKQFSMDSFLYCGGHHWVTHYAPQEVTPRSSRISEITLFFSISYKN